MLLHLVRSSELSDQSPLDVIIFEKDTLGQHGVSARAFCIMCLFHLSLYSNMIIMETRMFANDLCVCIYATAWIFCVSVRLCFRFVCVLKNANTTASGGS